MVPGEFPYSKESGESDTQGCIEVEIVVWVEIPAEFRCDFDKEVFGEGKSFALGGLVVYSVAAPEDALDNWIVDGGEVVFEVVVADGPEVILRCFDFDCFEEVGDPMCCGIEGCWEWGEVAVGSREEGVVGDGFGVLLSS